MSSKLHAQSATMPAVAGLGQLLHDEGVARMSEAAAISLVVS